MSHILSDKKCESSGCNNAVWRTVTGLCYRCEKLSQGYVFDEDLKRFVKSQLKPKRKK